MSLVLPQRGRIRQPAASSGITLVTSGTHDIATGSGTDTISMPGTVATNDIVIAGYVQDAMNQTVTSMSGWNTIVFDNGALPDAGVYYAIYNGSTPSTIPFPQDVEDVGCGFYAVFRGVNTSTPIDVTTTTASGGPSGIADPPSITTVTNNCCLVAVGGQDDDLIDTTGISGWDGFVSSTPTGTTHAGWMAWLLDAGTAGATDPPAFTAVGASDDWVAFTIALRPA